MLLATATADTIALIAVFGIAFPMIATGLIVYAIAQGLGERRSNEEQVARGKQQPSQG